MVQGQGLTGRFGVGQLHLHHGVAVGQPPRVGELLDFRDLRSINLLLAGQHLQQAQATVFICGLFHLAAKTDVQIPFAFGIGQAQHGLGHLVEQILGFLRIPPRGVLSHVRVELLVVRADLVGIVFKLNQTQQLVVIRRARPVGDAQPFLVDVHRQSLPAITRSGILLSVARVP